MWNESVNARLAEWRQLRADLGNLSLDAAVHAVNNLWSSAPIRAGHLDYTTPSSWPTPWELMVEKQFCDFGKALGIMSTLYFSPHRDNELEICIFNDGEQIRCVVMVNGGQYILNYEPFNVVNITHDKLSLTDESVLHRYSPATMALNTY